MHTVHTQNTLRSLNTDDVHHIYRTQQICTPTMKSVYSLVVRVDSMVCAPASMLGSVEPLWPFRGRQWELIFRQSGGDGSRPPFTL